MHEASTKSKNDASPPDAVKAQLASRLEQQPSCSRQNLSQSIELNEQSNERPLPIKCLSKKSLETVKERTQRKKVEGKTSGDSNVRADEHKLALLQLDAERCRSNRWRETERQRAERLAKVAERARKRRSTETDEERMLRLRKFAERKRQRAHEGLENEISEGVKRNSTLSSERLENRITVDPEHSRALTLTPSETTVASITDEAEIDLSQQRSEYGSTTSPLMQNVTANGHLSETQRSTVEHEEGCLNENASVIYAPMIAPPEFVAVSSKDSETPLLIGNDENTSLYPYSATEASAITNENNLLTYRRNHNEEERGDNVPVNQAQRNTPRTPTPNPVTTTLLPPYSPPVSSPTIPPPPTIPPFPYTTSQSPYTGPSISSPITTPSYPSPPYSPPSPTTAPSSLPPCSAPPYSPSSPIQTSLPYSPPVTTLGYTTGQPPYTSPPYASSSIPPYTSLAPGGTSTPYTLPPYSSPVTSTPYTLPPYSPPITTPPYISSSPYSPPVTTPPYTLPSSTTRPTPPTTPPYIPPSTTRPTPPTTPPYVPPSTTRPTPPTTPPYTSPVTVRPTTRPSSSSTPAYYPPTNEELQNVCRSCSSELEALAERGPDSYTNGLMRQMSNALDSLRDKRYDARTLEELSPTVNRLRTATSTTRNCRQRNVSTRDLIVFSANVLPWTLGIGNLNPSTQRVQNLFNTASLFLEQYC
ncbi:unnamed protein product [Cylicocyclus nassatus]|uniref:STPR domain-containing protein n=1 Tax=Cylicocyclus nassatus TaxID=53992 RepID=A0AA36M834_CYLNA|nr:unnamed protein product [Cylicocyclus nassatus]